MLKFLRLLLLPFAWFWSLIASIFVTAPQETSSTTSTRLDNTTKQNPVEDQPQTETQQQPTQETTTETTATPAAETQQPSNGTQSCEKKNQLYMVFFFIMQNNFSLGRKPYPLRKKKYVLLIQRLFFY